MKHKVISQLEACVTSAGLELEGKRVGMSYDGDKAYKSTDYFEIDDAKLDVVLRVVGLNGTAWKLTLDVTRDDDASYEKTYKRKGEITRNQTDFFKKTVSLED